MMNDALRVVPAGFNLTEIKNWIDLDPNLDRS